MKFLILALLSLSLFVACDDSKTSTGSGIASPTDGIPVVANQFTTDSALNLIAGHKFKYSHVFVNMKEEVIPECNLDDRLEFLANGNFISTANQPCDPKDLDDTGRWEIRRREGKIFLSFSPDTRDGEAEIIRIDADSFTITEVSDGERTTITFSKAR